MHDFEIKEKAAVIDDDDTGSSLAGSWLSLNSLLAGWLAGRLLAAAWLTGLVLRGCDPGWLGG